MNTNQKVGPIDRPYGEQRGTRGRGQLKELGQLQHFFFFLIMGVLLVFYAGDKLTLQKRQQGMSTIFSCVSFESDQMAWRHHTGPMTYFAPPW